MAISDIVMWTFVFIIATGFVTVVSTAVLLKRAKRAPKDAEQSHSDDDDDWKKMIGTMMTGKRAIGKIDSISCLTDTMFNCVNWH
ncbi:hypothetical protein MAA39_13665 [Lactiplantibacillus plantarum]|nr:hypothetical protein [Lactiplantibacillus plantarum]